jgi:hypothetical protein
MQIKSRPFFFFPAAIIGIGLAIVFFKVYGRLTKPDVPVPVAETLTSYAPGIALGMKIKDVKGLGELTWVRHVGYVSNTPRAGWVQTRLLPAPEIADRETGDPEAKIVAVELVSTKEPLSSYQIPGKMPYRSGPIAGCVFSHRPGLEPLRKVEVWRTKNDEGGVAIISGISKKDTLAGKLAKQRYIDSVNLAREQEAQVAATSTSPRIRSMSSNSYVPYYYQQDPKFNVWSVLVWNGKLDGPKTMRSDFELRGCSDLGHPEPPAEYLPMFAATDSLLAAFDVIDAKQREALQQIAMRAQIDSLGRFAEACMSTGIVHTDGWTRRNLGALPISVLMPADYTKRERRAGEGPDSLAQVFVSPDGAAIQFSRQAAQWNLSAVPDMGMETECEARIGGIGAHLETGRRQPAMLTKTTSAAFELPSGGWLVVVASSPTLERQQQQLRMIREIQVARPWPKPAVTPQRMPIDSL